MHDLFPFLRNVLFLALGAYLAMLGVLYLFQRNLLYLPSGAYASPAEYGLPAEVSELTLVTPDGVRLRAWHRPSPAPGGKLAVIFHGNGGNISYRLPLLEALTQRGLGYLALEYRGYPGSEGSPTEEGLYTDARTAIDWLLGEQGMKAGDLVLIGESLGGGVAIQMATEYDIALTVLLSPFPSVAEVAQEVYWFLPVGLLLKDRFDSLSRAGRIRTPVLVIHGAEDRIIPIRLGKTLYQALPAPKRFLEVPGLGHNDLDMRQVAEEISASF